MTKLITAGIVAFALFVGWVTFKYYQQVRTESASQNKPALIVHSATQLPGFPYQLSMSLEAAEKQGSAEALSNWLKQYGYLVQDPAKAWIELDYCVRVARTDPNQARRIFAAVKKRLDPSSPVWPRIQELKNSYE